MALKKIPSATTAKKTVKEFTLEQAQQLIQQKEQERQQAFINEYEQLCAKHGYQIALAPLNPQLTVVPVNK